MIQLTKRRSSLATRTASVRLQEVCTAPKRRKNAHKLRDKAFEMQYAQNVNAIDLGGMPKYDMDAILPTDNCGSNSAIAPNVKKTSKV